MPNLTEKHLSWASMGAGARAVPVDEAVGGVRNDDAAKEEDDAGRSSQADRDSPPGHLAWVVQVLGACPAHMPGMCTSCMSGSMIDRPVLYRFRLWNFLCMLFCRLLSQRNRDLHLYMRNLETSSCDTLDNNCSMHSMGLVSCHCQQLMSRARVFCGAQPAGQLGWQAHHS